MCRSRRWHTYEGCKDGYEKRSDGVCQPEVEGSLLGSGPDSPVGGEEDREEPRHNRCCKSTVGPVIQGPGEDRTLGILHCATSMQ